MATQKLTPKSIFGIIVKKLTSPETIFVLILVAMGTYLGWRMHTQFHSIEGSRIRFVKLKELTGSTVILSGYGGTFNATLRNTKGLQKPSVGDDFSVIHFGNGELAMCASQDYPRQPCYDIDTASAVNLIAWIDSVPTYGSNMAASVKWNAANQFKN